MLKLLSRLRREPAGVACFLVLQTLLGLAVAHVWGCWRNTLEGYEEWVSTKPLMERSLMGARSFVTERQALAGGALNLGAWLGHHEVVSRRSFDLVSLQFDFRLEEGSYLLAIFDRSADGDFRAFRLSWNRNYRPALLRVTGEGRFSGYQALGIDLLRDPAWHRLRVDFAESSLEAKLDGRSLGSFPIAVGRQGIGFRGGYRDVQVDNLTLRLADGSVLHERFSRPPGLRLLPLGAVALMLALGGIVLWLVDRSRGLRRRHLLVAVTVQLLALVVVAAAIVAVAQRAKIYPSPSADLQDSEVDLRRVEVAKVDRMIAERYDEPPGPGTRRLLFLGGSQTWGAGAPTEDDTWLRQLEQRLRAAAGPGERFECVNAGVQSARSWHLAPIYARRWIRLRPEATIAILGINDRREDAIAASLEKMANTSQRAGVRLVVVLEPNSAEHDDRLLRSRHRAMVRIAEQRKLPVIDMHAHLRAQYDSGLLWWDVAHLTAYGQRLFAEKLFDELVALGLGPSTGPGDGLGE